MSESWKRWEGRTVDGRFPLQRFLGASDHSAVFVTLTGNSAKAAIKLIPSDQTGAEKQLLRWKTASEVTDPNLIGIYAMGRCELDGTNLLYLVMELAEENLAQIIPERALTAEEVGAMLPPILRALQSMHDKNYVLGHIQPSNILAIGDQVKLSTDTLSVVSEKSRDERALSAYDPPETAKGVASTAGDVWQLGMTLVEVLTQRLPAWDRAQPSAPEVPSTVPQPFRRIAEYCLQVDAGARWTVAQISKFLETSEPRTGSEPTPAPPTSLPATPAKENSSAPQILEQRKASAKWPYLLGLAAVVVVVALLIARPKPSNPAPEVASTESQQNAGSENAKPAPGSTETGSDTRTPANADGNGVVHRVMPEVSASARRTIQGKIVVRVKAKVDASGSVTDAKIENGRVSKYFRRIALDAAREWKFVAAQPGETGAREWRLQFTFNRAKTEASAIRTKN